MIKLTKNQTIELRLDSILKERGWTQSHFSDVSGISRQQISQWVRRPSRIDFDSLARIAKALSIPVEELLEPVDA